jgi:predicted glycogen debranching enzyme
MEGAMTSRDTSASLSTDVIGSETGAEATGAATDKLSVGDGRSAHPHNQLGTMRATAAACAGKPLVNRSRMPVAAPNRQLAAVSKTASPSGIVAEVGRPATARLLSFLQGDFVPARDSEWLEADGLGGFASGTVGGRRTRRYHALLLAATAPPSGRMVLVNGCDVWAETDAAMTPLSAQFYEPGVLSPDCGPYLVGFTIDPWPTWTFRLADGGRLQQEVFVPRGHSAVVLRWRLIDAGSSPGISLHVRPFLSGRDYHSLHRENADFRFEPRLEGEQVTWRPYVGVPAIHALSNGRYDHEPMWYRNFRYEAERERGLSFLEDLAVPGRFSWERSLQASDRDAAVLILSAEPLSILGRTQSPSDLADELAEHEKVRRDALSPLQRAATQYFVRGHRGDTLIAGYPWFTDWGRDTFIALRGLARAAPDPTLPGAILAAWADTVSEGMLPNRFPDAGHSPEFNSVDASLWFCIAAHEWLDHTPTSQAALATRIREAVRAIVHGYARGTRYGIHRADDGLIAAGQPGVQLTWMDAKVGDWVVTPRIGKPVEVQALWLNTLAAFPDLHDHASQWLEHGLQTFRQRFWNAQRQCLFDVVDVDHVAGAVDDSIRPNQVFAVGGLPLSVLSGDPAQSVIDVVERHLWTPLGLRTLAPNDPAYQTRYIGDVRQRDGAYHRGTAWPWLLGAFVEGRLRVYGDTPEHRRQARTRFWEPLRRFREGDGLGHLPEVVDGDAPHTPRGCPFQAWSLGEFIRIDRLLDERVLQ